jgi:hypothetical protein
MEHLIEAYRRYNNAQRLTHHKLLDQLLNQFTSTLVLEEPYRLILDSNILMGIEKLDDNPTPEQLAILFFFDFLEYQEEINVSILVRPSVFYEYYKQEEIKNEIDHWGKYIKIKRLIEDKLKTRVYTEGLADFEMARRSINQLNNDVCLVIDKLKEIYSKDWSIDFIREFGEFDGFPLKDFSCVMTTPHQVAINLAPEIESKYLNSNVIKLCLANHISFLISNNINNDKFTIDRFTDKEDFSFRKLVKVVDGNKLKGVADLDLFHLCNIRNQFEHQAFDNYHPSSIPLTLDKDLFKCIGKLSPMVLNSYFSGGEAKDSIRMKFDKEIEEKKRVERATQRLELIYQKEKDYYLRLHELFKKV